MTRKNAPQGTAPGIRFVERTGGPERLACEAELDFGPEYGPLGGMKLVGFSLWTGADGEKYVTFPSRAYGVGEERRFFDYLRSQDGNADSVRRLKGWILDEYKKSLGE